MTLLDTVQGLIERTYGMRTGLNRVGPFVIGDLGLRVLYGSDGATWTAYPANPSTGARILLRETHEGLRAAVYLPDALVARLERYPPQRGLREANVDAFAALVEELDHLLLVAERAWLQRPVTLLELELHANVSKYLVLLRYLAGARRRVDEPERQWLRHHLFDGVRYCDPDPQVRKRYELAARWAVRYLRWLADLPPAHRLTELRSFHAADSSAKVRRIERYCS